MENHGRRDVLKGISALGALAAFRCGGSAAADGGVISNGAWNVLLASLQGDPTSGYSATFPLAVRVGQVNAG
jgi:hypothetical protein